MYTWASVNIPVLTAQVKHAMWALSNLSVSNTLSTIFEKLAV